MKKLLLLMVTAIGVTLSVCAQSSSCKVEGFPGAYITAEITNSTQVNGGNTRPNIRVNAYGVNSGSVEYEMRYIDVYGTEKVETALIYFSKDRNGDVTGSKELSIYPSRIISTKVYRADCRQ